MSGDFELKDSSAVDVVCFGKISWLYDLLENLKTNFKFYVGHVLFEMAAGYELLTPEPSETNLQDIAHYPQASEIKFQNTNNKNISIYLIPHKSWKYCFINKL